MIPLPEELTDAAGLETGNDKNYNHKHLWYNSKADLDSSRAQESRGGVFDTKNQRCDRVDETESVERKGSNDTVQQLDSC